MESEFTGKVAVITGGGGVLCSTMAKALSQQGAKIAILDLKAEHAENIANEIIAAGGQAIGVGCNVLSVESLEAAHKEVSEKLGPCDILVNGAGGNHPSGTTSKTHFLEEELNLEADIKTFFNLNPEGIKFVFDLNFIGSLLPTQVFAKDMVKQHTGVIINISSMNAFIDDMLMITPVCCLTISFAKTWVGNKLPMKLRSNTNFIPSGLRLKKVLISASRFSSSSKKCVFDVVPEGWLPPAPLTRISHGPSFSDTSLWAASRLSTLSTLQPTPMAWPPAAIISFAIFSACSAFRSSMAILAPCCDRAFAMVLHNTPPPPVITATLPVNSDSIYMMI